jgi:hypothetical protein
MKWLQAEENGKMAKKLFTPKEIEILSTNPYVKSVSTKGKLLGQCPPRVIFDHFKDEAYIKPCQTLEELKRNSKNIGLIITSIDTSLI